MLSLGVRDLRVWDRVSCSPSTSLLCSTSTIPGTHRVQSNSNSCSGDLKVFACSSNSCSGDLKIIVIPWTY